MAKKKSESDSARSVLTLPLCTEPWQEHILETRFAIMEHLKNQLIAKELRKLKNLERTREYRAIQEQIESVPKEQRKPLYQKRNTLLRNAGFSEYAFKDDMAGKQSKMQKHFSEHIAAQIAHRAASDVWRAFEKCLFNNGDQVRFHKRGTLESVACQTAGNGMSYENGMFVWSGGNSPNKIVLSIRVRKPRTDYEREMLQKKVKNMRVIRKWMKTRYKYYLQLTLEGAPVQKNRATGQGRVGIDIGPQTAAIAADGYVSLRELADRVDANHIRKCQLQQKMDRSRRFSNPEKYNPDGTINRVALRGNPWRYSNAYRAFAGQVRELERKNADIRKYQHTCLANEILSYGNEIYVEEMNFSGLQHRVKETKLDSRGRYQKKKRFGKSLANKAPASFLQILKTKANACGASYQEVDTRSFKASQYDHTADAFSPSKLGDRWKYLSDGSKIQRDLYSAFLLMNSSSDLNHADRTLCNETFSPFKTLHDQEIERIRTVNPVHPASFGF